MTFTFNIYNTDSIPSCCKSHLGIVTKQDLQKTESSIMAKISGLTDILNGVADGVEALTTELGKIGTETQALVDALANMDGDVPPAVQAAADRLVAAVTAAKSAADNVDALVPDKAP